MRETNESTFPLSLAQAQRNTIAKPLPQLKPKLRLDYNNQRTLQFTLDEIKEIAEVCRPAIFKVQNGMKRNSLRRAADAAENALEIFSEGSIHRIPAGKRLYQFKITLKEIQPPIWRRIQVKDCSLDKLHEHIQTAMGWTNSHFRRFESDGVDYGDPDLLYDGWQDETPPVSSLETKMSTIVPEDGTQIRFGYEYDFGDSWQHEILFEGCLQAEKGGRYPVCIEGERACPPEDVGGSPGYDNYLEAMSDPEDGEYDAFLEWRGLLDPEAFDAVSATKRMQRGLPDWRRMEGF